MKTTASFCLALLGVAFGVCAQEAGSPDLFSLRFAPGPFSDAVPAAAPRSGTAVAPVDAAAEIAAQTGSIDRIFDAIAETERSIAAEEALNGPQSSALIDHYRALAARYQDLGDPFLAGAALEQARAVIRMNQGLHSLDQAEVVDQTIEMFEAVGAFSESDALQDDLLDLTHKGENDSDLRVPSILAAVAQRQMDAAVAYLEDDVWPRARRPLLATEGSGWEPSTPKTGRQRALTQLAVIADRYDAAIEAALASDAAAFGDSLDTEVAEIYELVDKANDFLEVGPLPRMERDGPTWEAEPPVGDREFAAAALYRARRLYSAAMQAAYRQGSQSEYWALDEQLVETYFFEQANPELAPDILVDYRVPSPLESVLRARVADRLARGATAFEVARSLVELADAMGNRESLDRYQQAYDFLVGQDGSAEAMAALFHPDVPVIRRAFGPEDSAIFDPTRSYRGYIDVEVETGRYGQATAVEVLNSSPGTVRAIENSLRKRVSKTRFRPRFAEGKPIRSDRFVIRYFYDHDMLE